MDEGVRTPPGEDDGAARGQRILLPRPRRLRLVEGLDPPQGPPEDADDAQRQAGVVTGGQPHAIVRERPRRRIEEDLQGPEEEHPDERPTDRQGADRQEHDRGEQGGQGRRRRDAARSRRVQEGAGESPADAEGRVPQDLGQGEALPRALDEAPAGALGPTAGQEDRGEGEGGCRQGQGEPDGGGRQNGEGGADEPGQQRSPRRPDRGEHRRTRAGDRHATGLTAAGSLRLHNRHGRTVIMNSTRRAKVRPQPHGGTGRRASAPVCRPRGTCCGCG